MKMLKNMRVGVRLPAVVAIALVAIVVLAVMSISTLSRVKVGGEEFDDVMRQHELRSEIAPPVASMAQLKTIFLEAQLQIATGTFAVSEEANAEFERLVGQYMERAEYWQATLEPGSPNRSRWQRPTPQGWSTSPS